MKKRILRTFVIALIAFALGAAVAFVQVNYELQAAEHEQVGEESSVSTEEAHEHHHEHHGHEGHHQQVVAPKMGGAFSLTDHHGNAVTEKSWPGKHQLVFFGFTHCPDICPVAMNKFTDLMVELGAAGEQVVPILITVDPERDTPEAMKEYLEVFHNSIVGLTGTQEQIDHAVSEFKVYASVSVHHGDHGEMNHEVNHSGYTYFMSPEGELLELFDGEDSVKDMIGKIRLHIL